MRKLIVFTVIATILLLISSCSSISEQAPLIEEEEMTNLPKIDMSKWHYEANDDVYWQTLLPYAENPADESYETMGIFVPGNYFNAINNGDGTYTCSINENGRVGKYTSQSAPFIIPVNTPGYSAMKAPVDYSSSMGYGAISDYTNAGIIVIFAGARGRDAGAPAGVTDFKAAIRYTRYNKELLPGDSDSIFSLGMSGGGAQSALIGATGNSALYDPYLEAIGAVMSESDSVKGSMCWCPITNLDVADEAYEWNMGSTRANLSENEKLYSDSMALAFAIYINELGLRDSNNNVLTLSESAEGIYQNGSYYSYVKDVIETSLEHFLVDTTFPYTPSSSGFGGRGGRGPMMAPGAPTGENRFEQMDGIERAIVQNAGLTLNESYETKADYIAALNKDGEWVSWNEETNEVTISSVEAFTKALKNASKGIAAFDQLDRGQGENILFGYGDGKGAHFDEALASIVAGSEYEADFSSDLAKTDLLGNSVSYRLNMYNPMYYLSEYYEGYKTSDVATFWRIRSGINQGDTALCTEINLALGLENYSDDISVDFETVWAEGHTMAERVGDSTENFIAWVNSCME